MKDPAIKPSREQMKRYEQFFNKELDKMSHKNQLNLLKTQKPVDKDS